MTQLVLSIKLNNELSHRHLDDNGYLFIDESPVLKSGILEYYGHELIDGGSDEIDGIRIEPDKIYKIYISPEELEKAKDTFKLLPLTNDHQWLGKEGEDARNYQEGTSGETASIRNGKLYVPLKFTGEDIIKTIESREKEELSASYTNKLNKSEKPDYDFVATDLKGNHIALVEKGRCGPDVRVLNQKMENKKMRSQNDMKLIIGDKEIDLNKFFDQEEKETAHEGTGSITEAENETVDKRKQIDEIGGILEGKVDEEVWRTIIQKVEKIAYNPSEASRSDNEDKRKEIDEVGGFLKDKGLSDEDIRFVIGKMEKDAYEPSESSRSDNEDSTDEEKSENSKKCSNYDSLYSKIQNALKTQEDKKARNLRKAYNAASAVIGEFNPFNLSEREMLIKALNHQGIETDRESIPELYAMLKVCATTTKVDNSFSYGSASDEMEFNI